MEMVEKEERSYSRSNGRILLGATHASHTLTPGAPGPAFERSVKWGPGAAKPCGKFRILVTTATRPCYRLF